MLGYEFFEVDVGFLVFCSEFISLILVFGFVLGFFGGDLFFLWILYY